MSLLFCFDRNVRDTQGVFCDMGDKHSFYLLIGTTTNTLIVFQGEEREENGETRDGRDKFSGRKTKRLRGWRCD